jgi:hypothetical protein
MVHNGPLARGPGDSSRLRQNILLGDASLALKLALKRRTALNASTALLLKFVNRSIIACAFLCRHLHKR